MVYRTMAMPESYQVSEVDTPHKKLLYAIVQRAAVDLQSNHRKERQDAVEFLLDTSTSPWSISWIMEHLGLSECLPEMQEKIKTGQFISIPTCRKRRGCTNR
jgi:hypothetical protein